MYNEIEKVENFILGKGLLKFTDDVNFSKDSTLDDFITLVSGIFPHTSGVDHFEICPSAKNRSLGDLFRVLKYYKPEISLKELCDALEKAIIQSKITSFICDGINKRVYSAYWTYSGFRWGTPNTNEFKMNFEHMNDYKVNVVTTKYQAMPIERINFEM